VNVADTKARYMICQRCIKYFGRFADSNGGVQAGVLRLLLEAALSKVINSSYSLIIITTQTAV